LVYIVLNAYSSWLEVEVFLIPLGDLGLEM